MIYKLAPSILSANFADLGKEVIEAINGGANVIHIDVMDGHFVPNLTVGPLIVEAIKPLLTNTKVPIDVHLMVDKPEWIIPEFLQAGADWISVHVETCLHLHRTIFQIKDGGAKAGVAINPATPLVMLEEILPFVDYVLIMSVNPGFGGQSYIRTSTKKIRGLREQLEIRELEYVDIEVDGGIKAGNIAEIAWAGANIFVAGSAVFNKENSIRENIKILRSELEKIK